MSKKLIVGIHCGIQSKQCGGESFRAVLEVPAKYIGDDGVILLRDLQHQLEAANGVTIVKEVEGDPQLDKLTGAVAELVAICKILCKKIEGNEIKLTALARFVRENSDDAPAFGVL